MEAGTLERQETEITSAGGPGDKAEQLSFDVGGKNPTGSRLTVTGLKIENGQEYEKGAVLELRVIAEVGTVSFIDKHDGATGLVIDCIRAHSARCTSASVVKELDQDAR